MWRRGVTPSKGITFTGAKIAYASAVMDPFVVMAEEVELPDFLRDQIKPRTVFKRVSGTAYLAQ